MRSRGSITVYISIVVICIVVLINIVSEAARIKMVHTINTGYSNMAMESVLAGYGKQIYDDYGILLVWEKEPIDVQLEKYIQANINMADLNLMGTNLLNTTLADIEIDDVSYVINGGEEKFANQIVSYMKYAGAINTAEKLVQKITDINSGNYKNSDVGYMAEENNELQEFVEEIDVHIKNVKNTDNLLEELSTVSQKFEEVKKNIESDSEEDTGKTFLKTYRELIELIDKEAVDIDATISLIKKYEEKKEQFLRRNGYTADARDYIDENLEDLEKVKDMIEENKELKVSDFSKIQSKNVSIVEESIKKIETIEGKLKSLKVNRITEEDKKNYSIYESAKRLLNDGILSLVIEDTSRLSNSAVNDSNLPTHKSKKANVENMKSLQNKALITMYADLKFGNYVSKKKDTYLCYELEYIISGKDNDKENLKNTIEKLVILRNGINMAYLLTDNKKMGEISMIALSAASAMCMPFLEPIIKGALIEAWSLAEAVSDVKSLLRGNKVSLMKTNKNWKTSIRNLLQDSSENNNKGLDYATYCQILILLQNNSDCLFRIMDLIQINIQKRYNTQFDMSECFQGAEVVFRYQTEPLFSSMPWSIRLLNGGTAPYQYEIKCSKSY